MKMKRTFITAFFAMLLVVFSVSCSSEEKEFDYAALPMSAQQFVKQYFAGASYSRVEKEKDNGFWEYEVLLSDGSKVEFNEKGANNDAREEAYGKVVDMVLNLRAKAKADKDWATSDQIRDALAEAGFEVKDTKDGVTWKLNK